MVTSRAATIWGTATVGDLGGGGFLGFYGTSKMGMVLIKVGVASKILVHTFAHNSIL